MAWMVDKFLSWSGPETAAAWTPDRILTFVTLYWATRAIAPSMRLYANAPMSMPDEPIITSRAAIVAANDTRAAPPHEWLARTYADLRSYQQRQHGGHFMAVENPAGFIDELRTLLQSIVDAIMPTKSSAEAL